MLTREDLLPIVAAAADLSYLYDAPDTWPAELFDAVARDRLKVFVKRFDELCAREADRC
jgi:hypothetical protein